LSFAKVTFAKTKRQQSSNSTLPDDGD